MKIKANEKQSNRKTFYKLLDSFVEEDFYAVKKFAELLNKANKKSSKTLKEVLENAETDEEEINEKTIKEIGKAIDDYKKGKTYTLTQIKNELEV